MLKKKRKVPHLKRKKAKQLHITIQMKSKRKKNMTIITSTDMIMNTITTMNMNTNTTMNTTMNTIMNMSTIMITNMIMTMKKLYQAKRKTYPTLKRKTTTI